MAAFGVENITFSGGEPLIRDDFLEIGYHAGNLGFNSVTFSTNGTFIDRDIANQLKVIFISCTN